jgi:hypothetical protein
MSNTVSRVILQQLMTLPPLEKNGSVLMVPIKLSNVQMINLYNKHDNLRETVNNEIRTKYKLAYEVDTFIYPNLGINIINKTEEFLKCAQRQDDISTILNRKIIVEKDDKNLRFIVNIKEYSEELRDVKNRPFLDKLVKDLCIDNDVLFESIIYPKVDGGSISFDYESDIWQVSAKRIKNHITSKIGDILSNILVSDKMDMTVLQELYQQVVVKVLRLKYYDSSVVTSHFANDANYDDLVAIREELERHLVTNSIISSFLSIHKEVLFVLSNLKGKKYKILTEIPEFQYFILVLVDTLVRSFISKNTATSFYDRGGYSQIIDDVFFEGLRDTRHPGRIQILQFLSSMLETIDFDMVHMSLSDIQTTIQKFHGVNLADTNISKHTVTKLRAERDKLAKELETINKYILIFHDITKNMGKLSEFLRHFSEGRERGHDISLRYIIKSIKSKNLSLNLNAMDQIIEYIDKFLSDKSLAKLLKEILYVKGIFQKGSKEWHELYTNLYLSSFKAIMLKGEELENFNNQLNDGNNISPTEFRNFLMAIEDLKKYFQTEAIRGNNKAFTFQVSDQDDTVIVKQKGAADKKLLELVEKIQNFLVYFDLCDKKIESNISILKTQKNAKNKTSFIAFLFKIFDSRHNTLNNCIKKLELATGKKSKANIDSFYTMVKRIKIFYKTEHLVRNPLSNLPVLLPKIKIPPTYIQTIKNIINSYGDLYLETIFANKIEEDTFTEFQEHISEFYSEVEVSQKDKETIDKCLKNYFQAKQEQIKEEKLIAQDSDFRAPQRLKEKDSD